MNTGEMLSTLKTAVIEAGSPGGHSTPLRAFAYTVLGLTALWPLAAGPARPRELLQALHGALQAAELDSLPQSSLNN